MFVSLILQTNFENIEKSVFFHNFSSLFLVYFFVSIRHYRVYAKCLSQFHIILRLILFQFTENGIFSPVFNTTLYNLQNFMNFVDDMLIFVKWTLFCLFWTLFYLFGHSFASFTHSFTSFQWRAIASFGHFFSSFAFLVKTCYSPFFVDSSALSAHVQLPLTPV